MSEQEPTVIRIEQNIPRFTAEQSSRGPAIYHNPPIKHMSDGTQRMGWRFPTLRVSDYLGDKVAVLKAVAELLNKHWPIPESDRPTPPPPTISDDECRCPSCSSDVAGLVPCMREKIA